MFGFLLRLIRRAGAPAHARRPVVEELEPRILYSADANPLAWAGDGAPPTAIVGTVDSSTTLVQRTAVVDQQQARRHEIVFVDAAVPDAQPLIDGLLAQRGDSADIEIVQLRADSDALKQISAVLAGESGIDAVHIISHGDAGRLFLGNGVVDAKTLRDHADDFQVWRQALSDDADLLLWGCNVGQGTGGEAFVREFAALSGADVAASTDLTGAAARGGDWNLELQVGRIDEPLTLAGGAVEQWDSTLALTPLGGETRVNTTTTGGQTLTGGNRCVAMDGSGNYVVVWVDTNGADGSGNGIYAQRYNASGVAQGSEFRVNTTTAGDQQTLAVAMNASGAFVVTWTDKNGADGSGDGIYAQRYDAAGVAQGSEFRVNSTTAGLQQDPAIGIDDSGNFVIVWSSGGQDGSGLAVYGQRYNASGVAQGSEFRVNTYTTGDQFQPALAMDGSGNFVVVWTSNGQDGGGLGIYAQRYNASGVAQGSEFRVNTTTLNDQNTASVAMISSGFVISWDDSGADSGTYGIYAQRYDASGVAQGSEFRVNSTSTDTQWQSSVARAGSGFVVAWESNLQDGSGFGIYLKQYDAAGNVVNAETRANTYTTNSQINVSMAGNAAGQLVAAWAGEGASDTAGVYMQRFTSRLIVTNTNDSGAGSLRQAIIDANANVGADIISFDIAGTGVHTIRLASLLPTITGTVTIDATTDDSFAAQGSRPAIVLTGDSNNDGTGDLTSGLAISGTSANGSTIRGLIFQGFTGQGIWIGASNGNTIAGNWFGLNSAGTGAATAVNTTGIGLWNASNNIIGGSTAADRNVISGGSSCGVTIDSDSNSSTGNQIRGNYIGTDASGLVAVGNTAQGIWVNSSGNTIGGTSSGQGNVISGTTSWVGVQLEAPAANTTIVGNLIGLNATGTAALGNAGGGVYVSSANNTIGGTTSLARNVISGNGGAGIRFTGSGATGNVVIGNYVGTDITGTLDINGSTLNGAMSGIVFDVGASNNRVGTNADGSNDALERNVISGNNWYGVEFLGSGTSNNIAQGNYIGVDVTGLVALGNAQGGVSFWNGASNNRVGGGAAGAGNVISGNGTGVLVANGVSGNKVQGNLIGLGADGSTVVGNTGAGVYFYNGGTGALVTGNTIGTDNDGSNDAGERNVISGNFRGIAMENAEVTVNRIAGNLIGTDAGGTLARGNTSDGIYLLNGANANTVGGTQAAQANTIAFNGRDGIRVENSATTGNVFLRNSIYGNTALGINLVGGTEDAYGVTANDTGDADTGPNNLLNSVVLQQAVTSAGTLYVSGSFSGAANTYYRIDVYSNTTAEPSGTGEGRTWIGTVNMPVGASGTLSGSYTFTASVAQGAYISATLTRTDASYTTLYETSEFSNHVVATAPNTAPAGGDRTVSATEDTTYTFTAADFGFSDADGNGLLRVWVDTLPGSGALRLNGSALAAGSAVSAADIAAGLLTYVPVSNQSGNAAASFTFRVQDDGGTLGGGSDTDASANTLTIALAPLNDAPADLYAVPALSATSLIGVYTLSSPDVLARDSAGDGAPITFNGAVTATTGPTGSSALDLAGGASGQYGDIVGITTGGSMTIAAQVRFDATAAWQRVVDFGQANSTGTYAIYVGRMGTSSDLTFTLEKDLGGGVFAVYRATAPGAIVNGTWMHFAATVDNAGTMSLYVNGTLSATTVGVVPEVTVRTHNYIGKSNWAGDALFDGAIDNLVVANGALSASQVAALYQQSNAFVLPENAANGTVLGSVVAADADSGDSATFSLSDNAGGRFAIAADGTITVANGALLDYESVSSHTITVLVTDSSGATRSENFTIGLVDVNDAPAITSAASVSVAENQTAVLTVTATDQDGNTPSYSIVGGADAARFTIDAATGVLRFAFAPNFDVAADADGDNVYAVTVQAADGQGGITTQAIAVTLTNVNEAPVVADHPLIFDGTDVVVVPPSASLQMSDTVTVEALIQRTGAISANQVIVNKEGEYEIGLSSSGTLMYAFANTTPGWNWVDTGVKVPADTWTHVAVTYDHGAVSAYVDGQLVYAAVGSGTIGDVYGTMNDLTIGGRQNTGSQRFVGMIDDVRVWNVARSAAEIDAARSQNLVGNEAGLMGYWRFDEASGATAVDSSGHGNDGALGGTVDAPQRMPAYTVAEDGTLTVSLPGMLAFATDADGDAIQAVQGSLPSNFSFFVFNSQGAFTYKPLADFAGSDSFTFSVSDGTLSSKLVTVTLTVTPVEDPPTIVSDGAGAAASLSVAEGQTAVTTVSATDPDLPAQTLTYSIAGGADAARFVIDANTGVLRFATAPDHEAPVDADGDNVYHVTVQASDGNGNSDTQDLAVTVTNVNEAPTITSASAVSVGENQTAALTVMSNDVDGDVPGFGIVGGADAALFSIDATSGALSFLAAPDYETPADANGDNVYEVSVQVADGHGGFATQAIAVTVTNVNEAPTITSASTATVAENQTAVLTVTSSDVDGGAPSYGIAGGSDAARFAIDPITGVLSFVTAPDADAPADADANNVYQVTVQASDGLGGVTTQAITVTVTGVNEAPAFVALDGAASYTENGTPVVLDADARIVDPELGAADNYAGATFTLARQGGADPQDLFGFDGTVVTVSGSGVFVGGTQVGTYTSSGGKLTVAFGANATQSAVDALVRHVVYANASDAPPASVTLAWSFDDGNAGGQGSGSALTASGTSTVSIAAVNDAPTLVNPLADQTAGEDTPFVFTVPAGTFTDADAGGTMTYSASGLPSWLAFDATTGTFSGTPANGDVGTTVVTVRATDGAGAWVEGTFALTVSNVNDAPVVATSGTALSHDENAAPEAVDAALTLIDVDSAQMSGATVRIAVNYVPGEDVLAFTDTAAITGSWDGASGTLTLTGAGTVAEYQAALRSVTYFNGSDNPSSALRSVEFIVTDDAGLASAVATRDVQVNPIDDAPMAADTSAVGVEDAASLPVTLGGSDVDGTVDQVRLADLPAHGVLYLDAGLTTVAQAGVDYASGPGGLTLYFVPTADWNGVTSLHFTVRDDHGVLDAVGATATITVTPVNDAPSITSDGGGASALVVVPENQTAVTTVVAGDADGDVPTYSIVGGADAGRFAIDPSTGVLRFVAAPDFEAPADADGNNVYQVVVQADDGQGGIVTQALDVRVADANEAPVFVSPASVVVQENVRDALTVVATDVDGDTLRYAIAGGADAARFAVDASTGRLSFVQAPDFEAPTDAAASNVYRLLLRADDGRGGSSTQAVSVLVTNVNEAPALQAPTMAWLDEPMRPGTVVATVSASDPDAGEVLSFSLVADGNGRFAVDASSGAISVAPGAVFDRVSDATLTLVLRVTDAGGLTTEQPIAIALRASLPPTDAPPGPVEPPTHPPAPAPTPAPAPAPKAAPVEVVDPSGRESNQSLSARPSSGDDRFGGLVASARSDAGTDRDLATVTARLRRALEEAHEALAAVSFGSGGNVSFDASALTVADTTSDASSVRRMILSTLRGSDVEADADAAASRASSGGVPAAVTAALQDPVRVASASLTAGFVWWLTRSGGLLTSILMGIPAWRHVDLLPVLAPTVDDDDDDELPADAAEDDARDTGSSLIEDMFTRNERLFPESRLSP